jgi:hypothetical protein
MTRANLCVITKCSRFQLEWGSDAYPDTVRDFLKSLATLGYVPDVDWLAQQNPAGPLSPGVVGNPYYYYEVNQRTQSVRIWKAEIYWVNAPVDWKERGYNCWQNEQGRWGYSNWRKGKLLETFKVEEERKAV